MQLFGQEFCNRQAESGGAAGRIDGVKAVEQARGLHAAERGGTVGKRNLAVRGEHDGKVAI